MTLTGDSHIELLTDLLFVTGDTVFVHFHAPTPINNVCVIV